MLKFPAFRIGVLPIVDVTESKTFAKLSGWGNSLTRRCMGWQTKAGLPPAKYSNAVFPELS